MRRWPWSVDYWLHVKTGRRLSERWDDVERVQALHAFPLQRSLSLALGSYVAQHTNCSVTIFRAGDPTVATTEVRFVPGDEVTGDCYMIDGPGISHGGLMEEPFVGALANALTERLDRAGAGDATTRTDGVISVGTG